jgi:hypothetical protein
MQCCVIVMGRGFDPLDISQAMKNRPSGEDAPSEGLTFVASYCEITNESNAFTNAFGSRLSKHLCQCGSNAAL